MTNLLIALANIVEKPIIDLFSFYKGSNRANSMGEALETYIKDVFCNSLELNNIEKDTLYSQNFSYIGNQNNPPDIIIKNGDAIEVKKIETLSSAIALNSSYPKDKLSIDDSRITNECRTCEEIAWKEKDIIYVVGVAPKETNKLKVLWFIYGDCYAANKDTYQRIADKISNGISEIADVELVETNELAKVKKVDPLGITDLRVRGMWHIENPIRVFQDIAGVDKNNGFTMYTLLLEEKYNSFPEKDRRKIESLQNGNLKIQDIKIKSPNNPAHLLKAKLISYAK
jgi:hypothetical protein